MRALPLSLAAVTLLACVGGAGNDTSVAQAGAGASHDPAAVQSSIDSSLARFVDAMKRGDTATMASVYTNDAVVMPSGATVARGRGAINAFNAGMFSAFTITDASIASNDLIVTGDYAIESGVYTMTMKPRTGRAIADTGKYVAVWQRQPDGGWKMIRDIFNTDIGH